MSYTNGFLATGALAAIVTLTACFTLADRRDGARAEAAARDDEPLESADLSALRRLSDQLDAHLLWRDRLTEPDEELAALAQNAAAAATTARIRRTLSTLADGARHSALRFMIEYNLAAGVWEQLAGLTMRQPMLLR